MKESQKSFLAEFDQPLRKHIVNFCNTISSTKYDVYILLARKAACFIDTLLELDLIEINGLIVSDRVLEYNTEWLKGKSVAIIDDTIISGTSIFKLINKLNKLHIKTIDVYAFCINEYWFVDEMLTKKDGTSYLKRPFLKLDHTSSLRFCKQIVDALSISPRPYNIDFPIYERIKLTNSKIEKLFSSDNWRIINTSSKKQIQQNILCCTINPTKKFIDKFIANVGWRINNVAHFKLRLYGQEKVDKNGAIYLTKVVPYIIFNPISIDNANKIICAICNAEGISEHEVHRQLFTDSSKLIFIQFYYAEKLFDTWLDCAKDVVDIGNKYSQSSRSLYLLFTPEVLKIINNMSKKNPSTLENEDQLFLKENSKIEGRNKELNPTNNLYNLVNPFLELYYKKELLARRIVRKLGKRAFDDIEFVDIVNRLEDGISIKTLKQIISQSVDNISDVNQILSLFLDAYVDNGVIVPITVNKNGYLYRGFRHGEEVPWGNYNNRLLGRYFQKYLHNINSRDINQTYFQKLLVLFVKIGIKEGLLEEYSTLTPRNLKTKLLSVKAHLFGMVSDYTELEPLANREYLPIIDSINKSYWTSKFLEDHGLIVLNNKNNFEFDFEKFETPYTNDREPDEPSDLDEKDLDKVNDIADIFSLLRKNKKLDEKELVLLTSCVSLHDNTASLAAELQIFLNSIDAYLYKIKSNLNSSFTISRLKSLRDIKQNYLWTAINSGYFKYRSYAENSGLKYIQEITNYLESENRDFEARIWKRYWRTEVELSKNEENELNIVNEEMGNLLLEVNISITSIHQLIYEFLSRGKHFENYFNEIENNLALNKAKINEINKKIEEFEKDNNSDVELTEIILRTLNDEKNGITKCINDDNSDKRYWSNYSRDNLKYLQELVELLPRKGSNNKNSIILSKILTTQYTSYKNSDITELIGESFVTLNELTLEIKKVMDDYKLTVPEWGKVQRKVHYNSFIHVNSSVQEISKRAEISKIIKYHLSEFELEEFASPSESKTINLLRISDAKVGEGQIIGLRGQFTIERMVKLSCKLLNAFCEKQIDVSISAYPFFRENGVDGFFNNQTKNFDIIKENLFSLFENNRIVNKIVIYDRFDRLNFEQQFYQKLLFISDKFKIIEGNNEISNLPNYLISINDQSKESEITIGIVTALPKEFAAVREVLDVDNVPFERPKGDDNDYAVGYIYNLKNEKIKVVVALMKEMGNNNAATTTTNLIRSFNDIKDVIVCGIAGGVPNISKPNQHVRLGDICVSNRFGVLQYDNIKDVKDEIEIRDSSSKPSPRLLGVINILISEYERNQKPWINHLKKYEGKLRLSKRPKMEFDILTIDGRQVSHPFDPDRIENEPKVNYGAIGSSNTLLKNERKRDFLRDNYGVISIEMEGSGIADGTWVLSKGYLIVRGIVDYCNADKNDEWHNYAAICAACYTKSIIERL